MAKKTTRTTRATRTTRTRKTAAPRARKTAAPRASSRDANNNKGMAIIAYILFFIPLLTGDYKKSHFVKFHTNQGTVLFLTAVALGIVRSIIWAIFARGIYRGIYHSYSYSYSWGMWGLLSTLSWIVGLVIMVFWVIGIINAASGKMKPLPLIGKITIIK